MLRYESSCTVLVANEYTLLNRLRKPETRCPASGSFVAEHHLERAGVEAYGLLFLLGLFWFRQHLDCLFNQGRVDYDP